MFIPVCGGSEFSGREEKEGLHGGSRVLLTECLTSRVRAATDLRSREGTFYLNDVLPSVGPSFVAEERRFCKAFRSIGGQVGRLTSVEPSRDGREIC